jgi:folate-dependent phosphoribosylglycinamide formyltransferase PurN
MMNSITDSVQVPESEVKIYRYDIDQGLIGWMDCGGSNLAKINEQFKEFTGKGIVRIVATSRIDHPDVNARKRAEDFDVPLVELDFRKYEEEHGVKTGDYFKALNKDTHSKIGSQLSPEQIIQIRKDVCRQFLDMIHDSMDKHGIQRNIPMFAAGGMALLSDEFVNSFYILNVHPGDLTKYSNDGIKRGKRIIVGDGWIPPARAISAGHESLYSTMHTMVAEMDAGPVHMRGYALPIDYNWLMSRVDLKDPEMLKKVGAAAQETLKHIGDHVIAGATFFDLFDGRWGMHESGVLAYRTGASWHLAPNGILPDDHIKYRNGVTPFKREPNFIEDKITEFYDAVAKISK